MFKKTLLSSVASALMISTFSGCGEDTTTTTAPTAPYSIDCTGTACSITGTINENVTLVATNTYGLVSTVKVGSGSTLTIPAGTKLYGQSANSYLAVLPGATLNAVGTAANPIIFTSAEEFVDVNAGDQGQWGGVSIFGNAQSNKGAEAYEADATITFGSSDASKDGESSGTLQYVIIRNTGYLVTTDAELNGLSLGGVGSGTIIENVAVINGKDDGIEIWGGTVNLTNIYVDNAGDDGFDIDHGWTGTVTNLYVKVGTTRSVDPRGFEWDSLSTTAAGTPVSTPTATNFTIDTVAASHEAIRVREGANASFYNGLINYIGDQNKTIISVTDSNATGTSALFVTGVDINVSAANNSVPFLIKDTGVTTASNLTWGDNNGSASITGSTIKGELAAGTFAWMLSK